jgi:hypothetical protein
LAPCATAAPLNRLIAAIAALNRTNMAWFSCGAGLESRSARLFAQGLDEAARERFRNL